LKDEFWYEVYFAYKAIIDNADARFLAYPKPKCGDFDIDAKYVENKWDSMFSIGTDIEKHGTIHSFEKYGNQNELQHKRNIKVTITRERTCFQTIQKPMILNIEEYYSIQRQLNEEL